MAGPINSPSTRDNWHLSVDDLFAPLPETPRLGGAGPFVINLSASSAPISLPTNDIAGTQHAQLYLIQRIEDGRMRYRLRLGPFVHEDDADAILAKVRDIYPSALTATAGGEDLNSIAAIRAKADAQRSSVDKQPEKVAAVAPVPVKPPVLVNPPVPVNPHVMITAAALSLEPSAAKPLNPAPPKAPATPSPPSAQVLQIRTPAVPVEPVRQPPTQPTASAPARAPSASAATAPIESTPVPLSSAPLSLEIPTLRTPVPTAKPTGAGAKPKGAGAKPPQAVAAATALAPALVPHLEKNSDPALNFEATQTVRPLTPLELEDDSPLRWFVIQLSMSDQALDPDTVPNLDIFTMYRLYSVAEIVQGRIMHALRLGFFGEEIAARAVASYLAAHYEKPSVKRVSVAERERFANQGVEARKDVGATGLHAAIEITSERVVRYNRSRGST